MSKMSLRWVGLVCAAVGLLVAAGCATAPAGTALAQGAAASAPGAAGPARAASGPAAASAPQPGQPPAFAVVIKDAKKIDGALTLWQKDDKFWIELAPADFGKPLLFAPKIAQGIGESGLFGGTMVGPYGRYGRQQLVEFRRVHNQVQLLARNTEYRAPEGTPEGRAVQAAFSPSLVGSAAVASQPHPDSKAVLIEANSIFVNDLLGIGIALQRTYRQGYAFDGRNSAIRWCSKSRRTTPPPALPSRCPAPRRGRHRRSPTRCPMCAACSSACTIRWPCCRSNRCGLAGRIRAWATSTRWCRISATIWRARRAGIRSIAGAWRRKTRALRCPSRSNRSPSGSTARSR
jgi:hypothetical protein